MHKQNQGYQQGDYIPLQNICYNLRKVARYGYCSTHDPGDTGQTHWGFCSRACDVPLNPNQLPPSNEAYEEANFEYFNTNPYQNEVPDPMGNSLNI